MNTDRIGKLAADLMQEIDDQHPNGKVREVAIVAEVEYEDSTHFETVSTSERAWIARALFENAVRAVMQRAKG